MKRAMSTAGIVEESGGDSPILGPVAQRVLISGGAGFIGSHLADAYLAAGWTVAVLDNFSTGHRAYPPPKATLFEVDLRDAARVQAAVAAFKPDVISHHAGQINVRKSLNDPLTDASVNLLGGLILLEAAIRNEVGQFIFASTGGAIYGDDAPRPTSEEAPTHPISPYGLSKLAFEEYLQVLGRLNPITATVFRYANVYGPRQIVEGEAGVIAIFTECLLSGRAPLLYGTGENTRDYIHVADVVAANLLVTGSAERGPFNLGTGGATSVSDLYAQIQEAAGIHITPQPAPGRPEEITHSSLDASRFRQSFGWEPKVPLAEGIARTVRWFAEKRER